MSQDSPAHAIPPAAENFEAPERRYTDAQLARLLELSNSIDCECPNHLAKLVENLVAFELYSKNCENRNEADRQVHAYLYQRTAAARAIMEEALEHLARFEEIEV